MQKNLLISSANRSPVWLAMLLLLVLLGQVLLPTVASLRATSSPALWDEICSVYSERQTGAGDNHPVPNGHHVSCPACLHMVGDLILAATQPITNLRLFLLREVGQPDVATTRPLLLRLVPQARAPPSR